MGKTVLKQQSKNHQGSFDNSLSESNAKRVISDEQRSISPNEFNILQAIAVAMGSAIDCDRDALLATLRPYSRYVGEWLFNTANHSDDFWNESNELQKLTIEDRIEVQSVGNEIRSLTQ